MLIYKTNNLTIDVRHSLGTSYPMENGKTRYPFNLDITLQVNGKLKRTSIQFEVYNYTAKKNPEPYEMFEISIIHNTIHLLQGIGYDIYYSKICNKIESYVDNMMPKILKD